MIYPHPSHLGLTRERLAGGAVGVAVGDAVTVAVRDAVGVAVGGKVGVAVGGKVSVGRSGVMDLAAVGVALTGLVADRTILGMAAGEVGESGCAVVNTWLGLDGLQPLKSRISNTTALKTICFILFLLTHTTAVGYS